MKIVHLVRSTDGGTFRCVSSLIEHQLKKGDFVTLIVSPSDNFFLLKEHHPKLTVLNPKISNTLSINGVTVLFRLWKHFRTQVPDIFHGHGAAGGVYSRILSYTMKSKCIYTPHGGVIHFSANKAKGKLFRLIERQLSRITNLFIFESAFSEKCFFDGFVSDKTNAESVVIHNGVGSEEFRDHSMNRNSLNFGFIGELRKIKGIYVLLDALELVGREENATYHETVFPFVIAGNGPESRNLDREIRKRGLQDLVSTVGFIDKTIFFNKIDCVLVPSLSDSFPYVVIEGLASKKIVLAFATGGIPEIFGKESANLLIEDKTPEGLKNAILDVASSRLVHKSFNLAHNHVKNHFIAKKQLELVYQQYKKILS